MNQQTAQGLASLGRGSDSMLVHMAPEEVAGLQALALKHGGTLTINPETGLAEAGFLKSILPMVAGFALGPAGFGLMSSAMAGLTVGGISALTSGSLEKGLMAGLGAYGGAELGVGFSNAAPAPDVLAPATTPAVAQASNVAAIGSAGPPTIANAATGPASGFNPAFDPTVSRFVTPATPSAFPATITQPPPINLGPTPVSFDRAVSGFKAATDSPGAALAFAKDNVMPLTTLGIAALSGGNDDRKVPTPQSPGMIRPYTYARTKVPSAFDRTANDSSSKERQYFNDQYTALNPYKAPGPEYMAEGGSVGGYTYDPRTGLYTKPGGQGATTVSPTGGISALSGVNEGSSNLPSGPPPIATPEEKAMFEANNQKINDFFTNVSKFSVAGFISSLLEGKPQDPATVLDAEQGALATGMEVAALNNVQAGLAVAAENEAVAAQTAEAANSGPPGADPASDSGRDAGNSGSAPGGGAAAGGLLALAQGGMSNLGSYSDGGRLLRGPGDGVSDSIPAMIGQKQEARLADGEFVVPARIVSELGNGSTEAGARQLYAMMDRVQKARKKTVGKDKVATNSRAAKLLPA